MRMNLRRLSAVAAALVFAGSACAQDRASFERREAASFVECEIGDRVLWGVGIDHNIVTASLKALVSAVNRSGR